MSPVLTAFAAFLLALAPVSAVANDEVSRVEIESLAGTRVDVGSMNNHGTIVGAITRDLNRPAVPFRWTRQRGIELFLGDSPGKAIAVNDRGSIVGVLLDASGEFVSGFLWTPRQGVIELGAFVPAAINNRGQISGSCFEANGSGRPCLWEDGVRVELGDGVTYGAALAINERGEVAGQLELSAFVWSRRTGLMLLPSSGPDHTTFAEGINNHTELVGAEFDGSSSKTFPVRWTRSGEIRTLPQFEGPFLAINASGLAVGRYAVPVAEHRFDWVAFAETRGGTLVSLGFGLPLAVNDRGAILGTTGTGGNQRVVIWRIRRINANGASVQESDSRQGH
jgi:hypothetical protein